jgi:hypothetical protein
MKSFPKPVSVDAKTLLLAEGGVANTPVLRRDPIEAFIELLEVIEILCPVWPPRNVRIASDYRL